MSRLSRPLPWSRFALSVQKKRAMLLFDVVFQEALTFLTREDCLAVPLIIEGWSGGVVVGTQTLFMYG